MKLVSSSDESIPGLNARVYQATNRLINTGRGSQGYFFDRATNFDLNPRGEEPLTRDEWFRREWKLRHPEQLFDATEEFHSEIIAFRMEKVNSFTGKVIKEYYFWNAPVHERGEKFRYIDNQVLIGSKYRYNIYALNLVLAAEYEYMNKRPVEDPAVPGRPPLDRDGNPKDPAIRFDLKYSPCFKIIESPYFSQEVTISVPPPLAPTVEVLKIEKIEETRECLFAIKFTSPLGRVKERGVTILDEDGDIFKEVKQEQLKSGLLTKQDGKVINFSSTVKPTAYEIFVLNEKPSSIKDFGLKGQRFEISSEDLMWNFIPEPNKDKYMLFRSKVQNKISNPTNIFKFRYNLYGDGEYYEFDLYEINNTISEELISFKRFLGIYPSARQKVLNIRGNTPIGTPESDSISLSTAPAFGEISLGNLNRSDFIRNTDLWGRRFKIRITSKTTGKKIDFNIKFIQDKIEYTGENYVGQGECSSGASNLNRSLARVDAEATRIISEGESYE